MRSLSWGALSPSAMDGGGVGGGSPRSTVRTQCASLMVILGILQGMVPEGDEEGGDETTCRRAVVGVDQLDRRLHTTAQADETHTSAVRASC